ncbi:MAG: hypothetical protein RRY34_03465, partial [Victivallaceae bacterium]
KKLEKYWPGRILPENWDEDYMVFKKFKFLAVLAAAGFTTFNSYGGMFDLDEAMFKKESVGAQLGQVKSDTAIFAGDNLIAKGHVVVPYGDLLLQADNAIINLKTKTVEASGNIKIYRFKIAKGNFEVQELSDMHRNLGFDVEITGYQTSMYYTQTIEANRVLGNLSQGTFDIEGLSVQTDGMYLLAERATRLGSGVLEFEKARLSTCKYLPEDNGHYSINLGTGRAQPVSSAGYGWDKLSTDMGLYTVVGTNATFNVYGMPILWMPVYYKPKEESPQLFRVQGGSSSDWGMFALFSRRFKISDEPYASVKAMLDVYGRRGIGYGVETEVYGDKTRTDIFAYSLWDRRPYEQHDIRDSRTEIPNGRYDFRISNVTHLTPNLDFRGHFEIMSDVFFNDDFFPSYFQNTPQPVTFAALEYEKEYYGASIYVRPRVNDFFNVVQQLPSARFDIPRVELFGGLFYEGSVNLGEYDMKWREFDKKRVYGNKLDPESYDSFRLDTLHFLYYPIRLGAVNLIPRAGGRYTYYNKSSKRKVTQDELLGMFADTRLESNYQGDIISYDDKGGDRSRFIGELGAEANTKFYHSWQNVRSAYFQLDGLRHVFEPYVNYTFIPRPTVDRQYLYYFDDVDRITEQNFMRLGMRNRLQTRSGKSIRTIFEMENFWDFYFQDEEDYNNIGDIGTKLTYSPGWGLSFNSLLLIDAGNNSDAESIPTIRHGRDVGHPGLYLPWLNKWELNAKYEIIKDFELAIAYQFQDIYRRRSAYSMGSFLSDIENGSWFDKKFDDRMQTVVLGVSMPLQPDGKAKGSYEIYYDFEEGAFDEQRVTFTKILHCWELMVMAGVNRDYDSKDGVEYDYSISGTIGLVGYGPKIGQQLTEPGKY